jgi:hypothetical protein
MIEPGSYRVVSKKRNVFKRAMIVTALVFLLIVVDFGIKTWEASKLVSAVERSENVFVTFKEEAKDSSVSLFLSLSKNAAGETYVAGLEIERQTILPWHRDLIDAREDYLAHNKAWYESLSTTRIENDELTREGDEDITPTWIQVKYSLPNSLPSPDIMNLEARVEKLVID